MKKALLVTIFHVPNFSRLSFEVNNETIKYGSFLNTAISFLTVAFAIYFFVVLPLNKLME